MGSTDNSPAMKNSMEALGLPGQGDRYVTITPLTTVNSIQSRNGTVDITMSPDGLPMNADADDQTREGDSSKRKKDKPPVPIYTIPQNATLFSNASMTALLGIVPVNGQVLDPVRFKIITGPDNIATN